MSDTCLVITPHRSNVTTWAVFVSQDVCFGFLPCVIAAIGTPISGSNELGARESLHKKPEGKYNLSVK